MKYALAAGDNADGGHGNADGLFELDRPLRNDGQGCGEPGRQGGGRVGASRRLHRRRNRLRERHAQPGERLPDLPAGCQRVHLDHAGQWDRMREHRSLRGGRVRQRLRGGRCLPRERRHQPAQPVPELPARDDRQRVDQPRGRHGLRRRSDLQRRSVRRALRHQRDGLHLRNAEPWQPLPVLLTHNDDRVEQRGRRHELRHGSGLRRRRLHPWLLHCRDPPAGERGEPERPLPGLPADLEHDHVDRHRQRNSLRRGWRSASQGPAKRAATSTGPPGRRTRRTRATRARAASPRSAPPAGATSRTARPAARARSARKGRAARASTAAPGSMVARSPMLARSRTAARSPMPARGTTAAWMPSRPVTPACPTQGGTRSRTPSPGSAASSRSTAHTCYACRVASHAQSSRAAPPPRSPAAVLRALAEGWQPARPVFALPR